MKRDHEKQLVLLEVGVSIAEKSEIQFNVSRASLKHLGMETCSHCVTLSKEQEVVFFT